MSAQEKIWWIDRLETEHRNLVQAQLLTDLFGEGEIEKHLTWIDAYSKTASDIMDGESPEGVAIRSSARSGDYKTAAKLLATILPNSVRTTTSPTKAAI